MEITKEKIKEDLIKIGVKKGQIVGVHSSLKSIGYVIGGPDTVIDALLEVVGEDGTIIMPTFSNSTADATTPFSIKNARSNDGLITETFRKRSNAIRSFHPTHSVTGIGKEAEFLTKDHMKTSALGENSPFHKAAQKGSYILLIGVDNKVNSTLHIAEVLAKVPYLHIPVYGGERAKILKDDGTIEIVDLDETPGHSKNFIKLDPILIERNILHKGKIGLADSYFMKADKLLEVACEELKKDPFLFLCDNPNCVCAKRWIVKNQ